MADNENRIVTRCFACRRETDIEIIGEDNQSAIIICEDCIED